MENTSEIPTTQVFLALPLDVDVLYEDILNQLIFIMFRDYYC